MKIGVRPTLGVTALAAHILADAPPSAQDLTALTRKDFVAAFMKLCAVVDFETIEEAGRTYCLNVTMASRAVAA